MLGLLPSPWLILGGIAALAVAFIAGAGVATRWHHVAELKAAVADYQAKQEASLAAQKRIQDLSDDKDIEISKLEEQGKDAEQAAREAQARADAAEAAAPVDSKCPPVRSCGFSPADIDRLRNASPIGGRPGVSRNTVRGSPPVSRSGH